MAVLAGSELTGCDSIPDFISAGSIMVFIQTSAPTSWTKDTTVNDTTLRVVTGTATPGGTTAFSTVFANRTVSGSLTQVTINSSPISISSQGATAGGTVSATVGQIDAGTLSATINQVTDSGQISAAASGQTSITGSVSGTTLVTSTIPAHTHQTYLNNGAESTDGKIGTVASFNPQALEVAVNTDTGGGQAHQHSITAGSHSHTISGTYTGQLHNHTAIIPSTVSQHSHTWSGSLSETPHTHSVSGTVTFGQHNHTFSSTLSFAIQYVDVILASKN